MKVHTLITCNLMCVVNNHENASFELFRLSVICIFQALLLNIDESCVVT